MIGVRLSIFDTLPYQDEPRGRASRWSTSICCRIEFGFGVDADDPLRYDLTEPIELLRLLKAAGVPAVNISLRQPLLQSAHPAAGDLSAQRRLSAAGGSAGRRRAADSKRRGSASGGARSADGRHRLLVPAGVRAARRPGGRSRRAGSTSSAWAGWCCRIPSCRRHARAGRAARKRVCRTFSDCTTAPRNGLISGCFPLDPYYKELPEAEQLKEVKQEVRNGMGKRNAERGIVLRVRSHAQGRRAMGP